MLGSGGVRRLAGRIHRGQIDRSGEPVLTGLARAAAAAGGDRTARMVAWPREADTAGVGPADAGFRQRLAAMATGSNDDLRVIATDALAMTGDPAYRPLLRDAVRSADPRLVGAALDAADLPRLVELLWPEGEPWRCVRRRAAGWLAVRADDPHPDVRRAAAAAGRR